MQVRNNIHKKEGGQGLLEYSVLMVLVAVVVFGVLYFLGFGVQNLYCQIINEIEGNTVEECQISESGNDSEEESSEEANEPGVIVITRAKYNSRRKVLYLDATYNGGTDPDISLTASPGGVMKPRGGKNPHYYIKVKKLKNCPCTVTVSSNDGAEASVTVGP